MIDKDEYPQTAEIEQRCVNMLADLWNVASGSTAIGCSTTGSSEACMLGGHGAASGNGGSGGRPPGKSTDQAEPGDGLDVQVCWEKFCRYWEVEPRYVPMVQGRLRPARRRSCGEVR